VSGKLARTHGRSLKYKIGRGGSAIGCDSRAIDAHRRKMRPSQSCPLKVGMIELMTHREASGATSFQLLFLSDHRIAQVHQPADSANYSEGTNLPSLHSLAILAWPQSLYEPQWVRQQYP